MPLLNGVKRLAAQPDELGQRALLAEHPDLHRAEDRRRDAPRGDGDAHPLVGAGLRRVLAGEVLLDRLGEVGLDLADVPRRCGPGRVPGRAARRSA